MGWLSLQWIPHWNFWLQTLHSSVPTPAFLSSLTVTASSWLQKRQANVDERASFCWWRVSARSSAFSCQSHAQMRRDIGPTFRFGGGFLELLRLPMIATGPNSCDVAMEDADGPVFGGWASVTDDIRNVSVGPKDRMGLEMARWRVNCRDLKDIVVSED